MPKEIVFETINVEDPAQKSRIQFEAKIFNMLNGKQVYADEETGFIFQRFSGFAPKKFNPDPSKRDFVRITLDPEQEACMNLKKTLDEYDDSFEANKKNVFGKYDKLYKFSRSVKKPKTEDEEQLSDDEDAEKEEKEHKDTQPKFDSCKMKLKMDWFYYYQGERLDKANTNIVKKAVSDLMIKNKNIDKDRRKALLATLVFKLNFKVDDKMVQKDVRMDELEQKKEIDTKIFFRRPTTIPQNAEEFLKKSRGNSSKDIDEYESELVSMFGDPQEPKDIRHPDDLDKFYNYNCWVRFLYSPFRVWAAKTKDPDADKRKSGIKYVINSIDIIQLPIENNYSSTHKVVYSKYAFGKRGNDNNELLINQSVDTVFTSVEKAQKEEKVDTKADKTDKSSKQKKQMKVESESEEESGDESEESESEESGNESEESEESESEPEPEPVKKGKGKTVVEQTKNTKSAKKTK